MSKTKRKFSTEAKLKILEESKLHGVKITLEKHGVYPATFYSWREKYGQMGEEGFRHGITPAQLKEIRRLEKENAMLKEIIAEKELESKLKDEMLKKKYPLTRKK
ncbi:transposase [Lutimonas sp.]|uniref:transposase n=1 Tax=Lutimonas sp. TaxID=1872403 RepID=UPI003C735A45